MIFWKDWRFHLALAAAPAFWLGLYWWTSPGIAWVWPLAAPLVFLWPALFYPVSFTLWQAIDLWMRGPTEAELAAAIEGRQEFLKSSRERLRDFGERADDDLFLLYTGGTTGVPKGTLLSHRNIVSNITQSKQWIDFKIEDHEKEFDHYWINQPLCHDICSRLPGEYPHSIPGPDDRGG